MVKMFYIKALKNAGLSCNLKNQTSSEKLLSITQPLSEREM